MSSLQIALVGSGSALGGMTRFVVSQLVHTSGRFPEATLIINVVGSFAFGLIAGLLAKAGSAEWVRSARLFAIVGICGGFTTFSTFSNETFVLMKGGQFWMAALYSVISLIGGLADVYIGYLISQVSL